MHGALCAHAFAPRSIAIVGASERNFYARNALQRLDDCGYAGEVYLVNPNSRSVFGRPCYPRVTSIDREVEMVFVAVPRAAVMGALREGIATGAKAAVVVTTGFGESRDAAGAALQRELASLVADHPLALCGPSCLGVINVAGRFEAFGGHPGTPILSGGVALVSQSGANVHSYVSGALARNLGFSYLVSSGNEVGLETADYIDFFLEDPGTRVVCAYVESFKDPQRLTRVASKALALGKPIIAMKIGRSQSSTRAALAHTGALTGPDELFDTLFRQYGIIRAGTIEESLDRALIFASSERKWWPAGERAGVVSISGGFAAAFADLASTYGLAVPEVSVATAVALGSILPPHVSPQNPIDISTQVQRDRPQAWRDALAAMARDESVDFVLDAEALAQMPERIGALLETREATGKAVVLASTSPHISILDPTLVDLCRSEGIPVLHGVEATVRALDSVMRFTAVSRRAKSPVPARAPLPKPAHDVLDEVDARAILDDYGIRGPASGTAATPDEAAAIARRIGGRVAIKIVSRSITHRSDRGLVRLDVAQDDVADVATQLQERLGPTPAEHRILVQAMTPGIAELFVGVSNEVRGLPLLLVGPGGLLVELLGDRVTRVCPVSVTQAEEMLQELRIYPALRGYRGRALADVAGVAQAIAGLSRFAVDASDWLAEAEINPLMVLPQGEGASAVDALIVARAES